MIEITQATQQDIELINSLANKIFRPTFKDILSSEQVDYMFEMMYAPHNIQQQMEAAHQYYIALRDGVPCGYLSIRKIEEAHYHIEKIYTLPEVQGSGVGVALFEHACSLVLEMCDCQECLLDLNVNRYNKRAIAFYTKMGMRADHQEDIHIGDGYYANDYIMVINLSNNNR